MNTRLNLMTSTMRTPSAQALFAAIPNFYPDEPPPATPLATEPLPDAGTVIGGESTQPAGDADDTQPAGDNTQPAGDEGSQPAGDADDKVAAPEAYELKVTDAEGKDIPLDADTLAAATPIFKAANLTNDQAQAVVAHYAKDVLPTVANTVQQQTLDLLGLGDMGQWAAQLKTDKEFGGKDYDKNLTIIAAGRDAFATPELRAVLETSRLGNHPEVVRLFYKLGLAKQEAGVVVGDAGTKPNDGRGLYSPAYSPPDKRG